MIDHLLRKKHLAGPGHEVFEIDARRSQHHTISQDRLHRPDFDERTPPTDTNYQRRHRRILILTIPARDDINHTPHLGAGLIERPPTDQPGDRDQLTSDTFGDRRTLPPLETATKITHNR